VLVLLLSARRRIGHGWHRRLPLILKPLAAGEALTAAPAKVLAAIRRRG
jgi:hypothetical protein